MFSLTFVSALLLCTSVRLVGFVTSFTIYYSLAGTNELLLASYAHYIPHVAKYDLYYIHLYSFPRNAPLINS